MTLKSFVVFTPPGVTGQLRGTKFPAGPKLGHLVKGEHQPKRKKLPAPLTSSLLEGVVCSRLAQGLNLQILPLHLIPEALVAQYVLVKSTALNGLVMSLLILCFKYVCNLCMCH